MVAGEPELAEAADNCAVAAPKGGAEAGPVHVHSLCCNDARMIPYFFRHYRGLADRFFVYDDSSTDGSLELLSGDERVRVVPWSAQGDSLFDEARLLADNAWKQSRGAARWVFVVDLHEHLFHRDLRALLRAAADRGATAVPTIGYEMVAENFPTEEKPLARLITRGIRFPQLDKLAIFDPAAIAETNFQVGCHVSQPVGRVIWEKRYPVTLLSYARLGVDYICTRNELLRSRLRQRDIAQGYAYHAHATRSELALQHATMLRMAGPVPVLAGAIGGAVEQSVEQERAVLRESGLFEENWYLLEYPDVRLAGMDALEHFCRFGWREGRKPNPFFDTDWYVRSYGELIGEVNPLADYILRGEKIGRKPARGFDPVEYQFTHELASSESPLRHVLDRAAKLASREQLLPEDFDPALYLEANPDVAEAGLDPAWHFLNRGRDEGRQLRPIRGPA